MMEGHASPWRWHRLVAVAAPAVSWQWPLALRAFRDMYRRTSRVSREMFGSARLGFDAQTGSFWAFRPPPQPRCRKVCPGPTSIFRIRHRIYETKYLGSLEDIKTVYVGTKMLGGRSLLFGL
jgi:hypothetical protein